MEEKRFNKKPFIYGVIILLIIVFIAGFFLSNKNTTSLKANNKPEVKKEIKIVQIPLALGTSFAYYVAQQEGFFAKYNLTAKFVQMDKTVSIQALLTKSVDYVPFIEEGAKASLKGAPVKTFMVITDKTPSYFVVRPGIKPEDIKRFAIIGRGSGAQLWALELSKEMNIAPEFVYPTQMTDGIAMLETKRADSVALSPPTLFKFREQGYSVIDLSNKKYIHYIIGLVTTDDKIKNNSEEVKGVIKAVQSAINFIQNNPEKTKKLLYSFYNYEKNEANNKIISETYDFAKGLFKIIKTPDSAAMKEMIQICKNPNYENLDQVFNQVVTPEDIVKTFDFRFTK